MLWHQRASTDVEECSLNLASQCLCNHSLSVSRWTIHQNGSWGFSNSFEKVWIHHWKYDSILYSLFYICLTFEIFECNFAMFYWYDIAFNLVKQFFWNWWYHWFGWNWRNWFLIWVLNFANRFGDCHFSLLEQFWIFLSVILLLYFLQNDITHI